MHINAPDWESVGQRHRVFLTHQMLPFAGDPLVLEHSQCFVPAIGKIADLMATFHWCRDCEAAAESLEAWPLDGDPWKAIPTHI